MALQKIRDHKPLVASFVLFPQETKADSDRKSRGNYRSCVGTAFVEGLVLPHTNEMNVEKSLFASRDQREEKVPRD
ncbi:hypothetical protein OS493_012062 [Desmophyllum pertusum]|uniref:Uncharacterized protein n=1 Tax=Desmophyllum pertusum TaxID=174260 RepID=A0A9X0DA43_9CNID|nr:hypothetical protein OS493_012062 [Desmophyllum pertusum]